MTRKVLAVYPSLCTGCRICEQYCSLKHHGAVNPAYARIAIHRLHHQYVNVPVACAQCSPAPCIDVCPEGAITRDDTVGGLHLDQDKCLSCRLCVESCPRGCIKVDPEAAFPLLCDLCDGEPQCVQHCPEGAVAYVSLDRLGDGYARIAVARMHWGREA